MEKYPQNARFYHLCRYFPMLTVRVSRAEISSSSVLPRQWRDIRTLDCSTICADISPCRGLAQRWGDFLMFCATSAMERYPYIGLLYHLCRYFFMPSASLELGKYPHVLC